MKGEYLFNDAVRSTDHAASNCIITITWKQPAPNFSKQSNTFLGGTRENQGQPISRYTIFESRYEPEMFVVQAEVVPSWYKSSAWGNNIKIDRKERGSCGLRCGVIVEGRLLTGCHRRLSLKLQVAISPPNNDSTHRLKILYLHGCTLSAAINFWSSSNCDISYSNSQPV
jgi:hypothetical protein